MMRLSGSVKLRCALGSGSSGSGAAGLPGFLWPAALRCCCFSASMRRSSSAASLASASSAAIASWIFASRFSLSLAQSGISSPRLSLPKISSSWTSAAAAAASIAMQQKRNHHARSERRLAQPTPVAAHDRLEIQALPHQPNDKPRDVVLGHEVPHIRRQKQRLIDIPGAKVLAHSPSLNQTRWHLNSDYSDRLLGRASSAE